MSDTTYDGFDSLAVEVADQVATIRILGTDEGRKRTGRHWELAALFTALRADHGVRVAVLTGEKDGVFSAGPSTARYESRLNKETRNDPALTWKTFQGLIHCIEQMTAMEKPIVAKVNGDATTLGSSLLFASDLAIAREDAKIADYHLGMGEAGIGSPYGIVPGDGGAALVPLHMSPMRTKEYLMLAREYTGRELADMGIINDAVPADRLDAAVDDMVQRLLRRSAYALAWTKRVTNRHVVAQLNMTLDAGAGYEMVNFHQIERQGWEDRFELA